MTQSHSEQRAEWTLPLHGCRIVQIASYLPGPLAAKYLCDLGAEVAMFESKRNGGDPLRSSLFGSDVGEPSFAALNSGKRSVCIDFSSNSDVDALHRVWLSHADVVIISVRPGSLDHAGLHPTALRTRHPRLVVCYLTGYGFEATPLRARAGHDANYLAHAGAFGMAAGK